MSAEAWSRHAKVYEASFERATVPFGDNALTFAGYTTPLTTPQTLIEIACGPGRLSQTAARMGFDVTATDYAEGMLGSVMQKARKEGITNIKTVVADGQTLEGLPDAGFDVALSNFGIFLFPDRCAAWHAALRVLKPGGKLLATAWAAENAMSLVGRYIKQHAVDIPVEKSDENLGHDIEDDTKQSMPPPVNATGDLTLFAEELQACGFTNVAIYKVRHEMCFKSGEDIIMSMLDNAMIAPALSGKDVTSVKLCVVHYYELINQGIDPISDENAPPPPTLDNGITPEMMSFWNRPMSVLGTAHIAIAEKPL